MGRSRAPIGYASAMYRHGTAGRPQSRNHRPSSSRNHPDLRITIGADDIDRDTQCNRYANQSDLLSIGNLVAAKEEGGNPGNEKHTRNNQSVEPSGTRSHEFLAMLFIFNRV